MAKAKPAKPKPAPTPRAFPHFLRLGVKLVLALALVGALLLGLSWAGKQAGFQLAGQDRYAVKIADLQFDAPSYIDKPALLTEVRYLSNLPETISSVAPETPDKLRVAFAKHPWVKDVTEVTSPAEGKLILTVIFRKPILALQIQGEPAMRAIDAGGILLPIGAPTEKLAKYEKTIPSTSTAAGQKHPDPDVCRAAELVVIHPAKSIRRENGKWKLLLVSDKEMTIATP